LTKPERPTPDYSDPTLAKPSIKQSQMKLRGRYKIAFPIIAGILVVLAALL